MGIKVIATTLSAVMAIVTLLILFGLCDDSEGNNDAKTNIAAFIMFLYFANNLLYIFTIWTT